jgi:hypothetical protein
LDLLGCLAATPGSPPSGVVPLLVILALEPVVRSRDLRRCRVPGFWSSWCGASSRVDLGWGPICPAPGRRGWGRLVCLFMMVFFLCYLGHLLAMSLVRGASRLRRYPVFLGRLAGNAPGVPTMDGFGLISQCSSLWGGCLFRWIEVITTKALRGLSIVGDDNVLGRLFPC